MGRKLMRVPLDFDWPQDKIWGGYLNPHSWEKCAVCHHTGYNDATREISDNFYGVEYWCDKITQDEVLALQAEGRLCSYVNGEWVAFPGLTAEMVNAGNRRGFPRVREFDHDAINRCILIETRAKRLGVYGLCPVCDGEGITYASEEVKRLHDEWEPEEPPTGDGYQLWETTSEGSPVSPVFATLEGLCEWCAVNATTFARFKAPKESWMTMLSVDRVHHVSGNVIHI